MIHDVSLIAASGKVDIQVMVEICQSSRWMPAELALDIVVPIFKGKGVIRSCISTE